jgi:branched-subunit amino acid aminotransferase/4-amino-4-deoxychorismate lyase
MRPVQDPTELVVLDGARLAPGAPALPAGWPGVLRGEGVFEAFRVDRGAPTPFLDRHAARLARSAATCGMELGAVGLEDALAEILPLLDPAGAWRLRYTVLRRDDGGLARLWTAGRAPPSPAQVTLAIGEARVDPHCPLAGAKTDSRMATSWRGGARARPAPTRRS